MDCGIPFCNNGCPLGNLIPDWNDLVYRDSWREAIERLHATNNFPEFTGRLCPAPCEAACVLGINSDPVAIKQVEVEIIDRAWDEGWVEAQPPAAAHREERRGRGLRPRRSRGGPAAHARGPPTSWSSSGPTASAACCATASPSSRWRSGSSSAGSTRCAPRAPSSAPSVDGRCRRHRSTSSTRSSTRSSWPAGATAWRDLPIPGRELGGIHQAMEFLPLSNRVQEGDLDAPPITAEGKHVVIIGGGDTGADCLGTVHRQGAAAVHQFEILAEAARRARARRTRGRSGRWSTAPRRPTKRVASASSA